MSKVAISGNASGSGIFTIAAPNSNTDRTLTLPDSAGTLLHDSSSLAAANLTGTIAAARMPAGSVVQVESTNSTTQYTTSTQYTYINTVSLVVTPKRSNSKFIIQASGHLYHNASGGRGRFGFSVTQSGTTTRLAGTDGASGDSWASAYPGVEQHRLIVWDSSAPAGTAITFNLLIGMFDTGTLYLNYSGYSHKTYFVVTEVAV